MAAFTLIGDPNTKSIFKTYTDPTSNKTYKFGTQQDWENWKGDKSGLGSNTTSANANITTPVKSNYLSDLTGVANGSINPFGDVAKQTNKAWTDIAQNSFSGTANAGVEKAREQAGLMGLSGSGMENAMVQGNLQQSEQGMRDLLGQGQMKSYDLAAQGAQARTNAITSLTNEKGVNERFGKQLAEQQRQFNVNDANWQKNYELDKKQTEANIASMDNAQKTQTGNAANVTAQQAWETPPANPGDMTSFNSWVTNENLRRASFGLAQLTTDEITAKKTQYTKYHETLTQTFPELHATFDPIISTLAGVDINNLFDTSGNSTLTNYVTGGKFTKKEYDGWLSSMAMWNMGTQNSNPPRPPWMTDTDFDNWVLKEDAGTPDTPPAGSITPAADSTPSGTPSTDNPLTQPGGWTSANGTNTQVTPEGVASKTSGGVVVTTPDKAPIAPAVTSAIANQVQGIIRQGALDLIYKGVSPNSQFFKWTMMNQAYEKTKQGGESYQQWVDRTVPKDASGNSELPKKNGESDEDYALRVYDKYYAGALAGWQG